MKNLNPTMNINDIVTIGDWILLKNPMKKDSEIIIINIISYSDNIYTVCKYGYSINGKFMMSTKLLSSCEIIGIRETLQEIQDDFIEYFI